MDGDRLEHLRREGFVVISKVLTPDEVDRLVMAFDNPSTGTGTEHVEIDDATPHREVWDSLPRHRMLTDAIETLIGRSNSGRSNRSPSIIGRSVVDLHGRNPLPGYGQQGLHADAPPRGPTDPVMAVTAIWMLDAFTMANGATRVVPGTHVRRDAVPRPLAQPDAHHPDESIVTGASGDVLVFDGHLWHSGTQNRSSSPRRAVQMTVRRAG